jgi:hypothetical protein
MYVGKKHDVECLRIQNIAEADDTRFPNVIEKHGFWNLEGVQRVSEIGRHFQHQIFV